MPNTQRGFPLWFRMTLVAFIALLLGYSLIVKADAVIVLAIAGIVATALGIDVRKGGPPSG